MAATIKWAKSYGKSNYSGTVAGDAEERFGVWRSDRRFLRTLLVRWTLHDRRTREKTEHRTLKDAKAAAEKILAGVDRWEPCDATGPNGERCELRGKGHPTSHTWEECQAKGPRGETCYNVEPIGSPGHPQASRRGHAGPHSWEQK